MRLFNDAGNLDFNVFQDACRRQTTEVTLTPDGTKCLSGGSYVWIHLQALRYCLRQTRVTASPDVRRMPR